jgi:nucleoside-diphosphate-sugar epimerase
MTRILIIGAGGFIGRHAVNGLAADGHDIVATHTPGRQPSPGPGLWVPCDLTAPDGMARLPRDCDVIVHLAQARKWRSFPEDAPGVFAVNLQGLFASAWFARECKARLFVYASSGTVYSQTTQPALESEGIDVMAARSFYAASRVSAEILLRPFAALLPIVQIRLFMPYGAYQTPEMLLPTIVRNVQSGQPITLHGESGLLANPVAIADVVAAIRRALGLRESITMNVAGPEILSLRDMAVTIGRQVGRQPHFVVQNAARPVIVGDTNLMQRTLGWRPNTSFAAGLATWLGDGMERGTAAA